MHPPTPRLQLYFAITCNDGRTLQYCHILSTKQYEPGAALGRGHETGKLESRFLKHNYFACTCMFNLAYLILYGGRGMPIYFLL